MWTLFSKLGMEGSSKVWEILRFVDVHPCSYVDVLSPLVGWWCATSGVLADSQPKPLFYCILAYFGMLKLTSPKAPLFHWQILVTDGDWLMRPWRWCRVSMALMGRWAFWSSWNTSRGAWRKAASARCRSWPRPWCWIWSSLSPWPRSLGEFIVSDF